MKPLIHPLHLQVPNRDSGPSKTTRAILFATTELIFIFTIYCKRCRTIFLNFTLYLCYDNNGKNIRKNPGNKYDDLFYKCGRSLT